MRWCPKTVSQAKGLSGTLLWVRGFSRMNLDACSSLTMETRRASEGGGGVGRVGDRKVR